MAQLPHSTSGTGTVFSGGCYCGRKATMALILSSPLLLALWPWPCYKTPLCLCFSPWQNEDTIRHLCKTLVGLERMSSHARHRLGTAGAQWMGVGRRDTVETMGTEFLAFSLLCLLT